MSDIPKTEKQKMLAGELYIAADAELEAVTTAIHDTRYNPSVVSIS